jgi:drug/metabolite transporter (DMT)-like permease
MHIRQKVFMIQRTQLTAALALIFATTAWGALFHVGKHAMQVLDPFWFSLIRYGGASFLLFLILQFNGNGRWNLMRQNWYRLLFLGFLGYPVFGILVFVGLNYSLPSHGAVIMATMPVTTLVLRWILDKQSPQPWIAVVIFLTFTGVILVSGLWSPFGPISHSSGETIYGDMMTLMGTFGWVMYTRGQAAFPELSVLEYTGFTSILSLPCIFVVVLLASLGGWAQPPSFPDLQQTLPEVLYVITCGTVLASLAFNLGVRRLGALQGIVFINFVPVTALLLSAVRGTIPQTAEIAGALLVIFALLLQAHLSK